MSSIRQQLGQYAILGPIGAGGMGEVYVARDPVLGRKVAIKVLPVRLSGDRDSLARFTQEARSASALNHPNIVTIHEVGTDAGGAPYIVMEHVEGRDLRSYVNEGPPLNKKLLDIAAQIADGLAAAHERGIVHRDLKPENLMVTNDGFVKILDFGLAKIMRPTPGDADVTAQLEMPGTTPGTILGTVGYMSPEQATGRQIDFRSDQFALGAILYELATGKPAFDGDTAIDTLSAILHDEPEPIHKSNPRAPAPFCWIVGRLLSKDLNERYASTRDLAQELRTIRDRIATLASGVEIPFERSRWKSKPLLWVGLLVALAAAAVFVVERGLVGKPGGVEAAEKYLAVLPFKDLSGDRNGQIMVDGFAETLSARLAHFPSVQVMRPNAADPISTSPRDVARGLGANLVLTGSMQRDGDRVRVSYQVIDVSKGSNAPGEVLDGTMANLFGLQDQVAASVASTLRLGTAPRKAPVLEPSISQSRYLEALGYLRRYDNESSVDSAISILEDLGRQSGSASIQAALGRAYLDRFQLTHDAKWAALASAACEHAVAADPENPDVHITLGALHRQTGRYQEAVADFQRVLVTEPTNADAVLGLAETYKSSGDLLHAETSYKRAIALQPNYWGGYNKLGAFYFAHGRYQESAKMFEKVISLVPDNMRASNNLGAVYEQMGRYDDAIAIFSHTIATKPTPQAYSNLGTCLYFIGRYDAAARAFENATKLHPDKSLYWANLGDAYRWSTQSAKAPQAYTRAIDMSEGELRVNPQDATAHATLAVCLAKMNRGDEANRHIQIAMNIDPENLEATYKAAVVAILRGDKASAKKLLESALARGYNRSEIERDPEFADLRKDGTIAGVPQTSATK